MDKLKISFSLIIALDALRLNLTHYYLLCLADVGKWWNGSPVHTQTLERKGYISEGKLTKEGIVLFSQLQKEAGNKTGNNEIAKEVKKAIKQVGEERKAEFERFYNAYPAGTTWYTEDGKKIDGGRGLRSPSKATCEPKFYTMLEYAESKGWTLDDIIASLEYEVRQKKIEALATGENKMKFMQLMGTYLNNNSFETWMPLVEEEKKQKAKGVNRPQTVDTSNLF